MKKSIIALTALTLILGLFNGAFAWTTYTTNHTLTYDGAPNGDGVYEFSDGLLVINDDSLLPVYFQIDPGVTLEFGDNNRGLKIEGNVILIAKGLPTSTGYILFDSALKYQKKAPMLDLVMYKDPKTHIEYFPKAIIEYCKFEGSIETAIRSESADIKIRYNRIHTDCNGIFMADDRYEVDNWVFSDRAEITGNIIEGYGGLFQYPQESAKGCTLATIEYAGSGIYFHSGVLNSITRNNILIQGENEKETGCGIYFRSLYIASTDARFRNIVNNNVIDHIPTKNNKLVEFNCGINIGINVYDSGSTPSDFDLEDMLFYGNNNIITETVIGVFIHKSNWVMNRPPDLPLYIDYNDFYENYYDMNILGSGGTYYSVEFGDYNLYEDPDFISISDVNYRLSDHSLLYDEGTNSMNSGAVTYSDIYISCPLDGENLVDMGAYSGGEECYRIQKHIPYPGILYDGTRSWSGSVVKDHNEFIIFEDNMVVEEYADAIDLETSFIEDLPPVVWEFNSNIGIFIYNPSDLSITYNDPLDPNKRNSLIGTNWSGFYNSYSCDVVLDNFNLSGCDEAFTGTFHTLSLNAGYLDNISDYLVNASDISSLTISNLGMSTEQAIPNVNNTISVSGIYNPNTTNSGVSIENCEFRYCEDALEITNTNSPITIINSNFRSYMNSVNAITIDGIIQYAPVSIQNCTFENSITGVSISNTTGNVTLSENSFQGFNTAISLTDCFSFGNEISDCIIGSANPAVTGNNAGIYLSEIYGISINNTFLETYGNCIYALENVNFTIDGCGHIKSRNGIGILSYSGFLMTGSCIRDCADHGIQILGNTDDALAPTLYLGKFYPNSSVEEYGVNLIYNCGQYVTDPPVDETIDKWMIDLYEEVNGQYLAATIHLAFNDLIIFLPDQDDGTTTNYWPCWGTMIDHKSGLRYSSMINNNYWGRYNRAFSNDGTPHDSWFSCTLDINSCPRDRYTTFDIPGFVDLGANLAPRNNISEHIVFEPNVLMANSSEIATSEREVTEVKNALMQISSLDGTESYSTDDIISQLSQWADPNGTTMLELESYRLIIRKLISQKKFDEATAALNSWIANPLIMKRQVDNEILWLSYSRKRAESKPEDLLKLHKEYVIGLDKIYGIGSGHVKAEKGEESNDVEETNLPTEFCIHQSYPNPFNPTATLKIDLPETADVKIAIFNVMGQQVYNEVHEQMPAGYKTFNINGQLWSSGTYFVVATAGTMNKVQKIVLIK